MSRDLISATVVLGLSLQLIKIILMFTNYLGVHIFLEISTESSIEVSKEWSKDPFWKDYFHNNTRLHLSFFWCVLSWEYSRIFPKPPHIWYCNRVNAEADIKISNMLLKKTIKRLAKGKTMPLFFMNILF